jgi:hypothetical protein
VLHKPHSAGSSNPVDDSAHPLTDDQAMAQVVELAKQIVAAADLRGVSGGFSFSSCNNQGDPPYMGKVTMSFLLHGDPDAYFQQVRAANARLERRRPARTALLRHNTESRRRDREYEFRTVRPQLRAKSCCMAVPQYDRPPSRRQNQRHRYHQPVNCAMKASME